MILSIESSCDDSGIAVTSIETKKLLFHRKISQDDSHASFGGVVPELAARLHAEGLPKLLEACREFLPHLKAVAVTNEPGLVVSLLEGVTMAKTLSLSLNIPLIGINHLIGHIYSLFIESETVWPLSLLLVSGGHTQLMETENGFDAKVIARTMDDSFGESFDKAAKMLGLDYPGGPAIESAAKRGDDSRFSFTRPIQDPRMAFSFSGLKNALRLQIASVGDLDDQTRCDLAAAFQKVAIEHLLHKLKRYFEERRPQNFAVVGGASANAQLREKLLELCKRYDTTLLAPRLEYCSDNAAMIGRTALDAYLQQRFSDAKTIEVRSRVDLN